MNLSRARFFVQWSSLAEGLFRETYFQSLPVLSRAVRQALSEQPFDLVHVAYWYALRRLPRFPRPPLWVVDTHDVQFERHERIFRRVSRRERLREMAQLCRYDRIVAITERDRETLSANLPVSAPPIEVIGMGLDLERWRPRVCPAALPPAPRLVFYGNLATPANQEGARHLLEEILPPLRGAVSGLEVLVLGADPPADLRRLAEERGARVTGFVDDPRPWLLSGSVLALSLRTGSGQRGRVVESIALGLPVVGYGEALEGLDFTEGEGIVVARDAAGFCRELVRLLEHPEERDALAAAGRRRVEASYGVDATYARFPALYRSLLDDASTSGGKRDPRVSPHFSS